MRYLIIGILLLIGCSQVNKNPCCCCSQKYPYSPAQEINVGMSLKEIVEILGTPNTKNGETRYIRHSEYGWKFFDKEIEIAVNDGIVVWILTRYN